jgi:hypothetical protein
MAHRLAALLAAAAGARFPDVDGVVEVVPPYLEGVEAVAAFTGHAVVATTKPLARLEAAGADAFGGVSTPSVLTALSGSGGEIGCLDVVLVARGTGRSPLRERRDLDDHPRVAAARRWRSDVHVHADERGLVTVSRGLGGLAELSFEVHPGRRGGGTGRSLVADGLGLVPAGDPVLVCVAPGNAASLRCCLAVGFAPVASVVLVRPGPEPVEHPPRVGSRGGSVALGPVPR